MTEQEFQAVYDRQAERVYKICCLYLGNPMDAQDAVQNLFLKLLESRYCDTFEHLESETNDTWRKAKELYIKYSEYSVLWKKDGESCMSCLLLDDGEYQLFTKNQDTGETAVEPLAITISKEAADLVKNANVLPKFVYTGEDEILKAVCEYLVQTAEDRFGRTGENISYTFIPAPVIYDIIEEDGEYKVFGNFYGFSYYKNGNILEESSGGEMPACIHLKKDNGHYQVADIEKSGDGAYYVEGIQKFCRGHEDICEKYFDYAYTDEMRRQMEISMIEQYVADNQLDIRYYHAYGWDPVELFTED